MKVDEIFALYLYETSRKTNDQFYNTILAFVIFYRECLNIIGWQKLMESEEALKKLQPEIDKQKKQEFC